MDSDTVDKQLAALRADDETIADALATLETQLTAWLSVMRDGQEAIIAGLSAPSAVAEPDTATSPELAPQASDESETPVEEAPSEETRLEETSSDEASVVEAEPAAESPTVDSEPESDEEPAPEQQTTAGGGMFQTKVPIRGVPKPERPKPEDGADASGPASSEEDEALLAELDEETARLIRVKRRLCNNERSVRELLDELQGEHEPGEPRSEQQRNRWWRRPNERQSD